MQGSCKNCIKFFYISFNYFFAALKLVTPVRDGDIKTANLSFQFFQETKVLIAEKIMQKLHNFFLQKQAQPYKMGYNKLWSRKGPHNLKL